MSEQAGGMHGPRKDDALVAADGDGVRIGVGQMVPDLGVGAGRVR
jgi:hypothetical protein